LAKLSQFVGSAPALQIIPPLVLHQRAEGHVSMRADLLERDFAASTA
jgi:hypothetical protein